MKRNFLATAVLLVCLLMATRQAAAVEPDSQSLQLTGGLPVDSPARVWTGTEVLLWWGGKAGLALNPATNDWRVVNAHPHPGRVSQAHLLRLASGKILAVYWAAGDQKTELRFDQYSADTGQWENLAAMSRDQFKDDAGAPYQDFDIDDWEHPGKRRTVFIFDIAGLIEVGDSAVVFISTRADGEKIMGVRLGPDRRARLIARSNAPRGATDVAIHAHDGKVFYYGYVAVDTNEWAVWDARADTWSKPEECARRYSFGHCSSGAEVYIFGGAESSAFGWIISDGAIYSFKDDRLRPLPVQDGPPGRRDFSMVWTGRDLMLWGGSRDGRRGDRDQGAADMPLNTVMAWIPSEGKWRVLPGANAPLARSSATTVWTGKEMIVWGGRPENEKGGSTKPEPAMRCHAYNPSAGTWRDLPLPTKFPSP